MPAATLVSDIPPLEYAHSVNVSDDLFTSQHIALHELKRRRRSSILRNAVRETMNPGTRTVLEKLDVPRAVLFRQVASPTQELLRFLRIAKHIHMAPLLFEYYGDKFVSAGNSYKRALGKMPIFQHTGTDGRDIVRYENVINFNSSTGKSLNTISCNNGKSLIDFHHELLGKMTRLDVAANSVDATEWFRSIGGHAHEYYVQFLSLFIRDGILFEQFDSTEAEREFTREVFIPAFRKVAATYQLRPLVVRLVPKNKEGLRFWDSYPKKIEEFIV